MNKLRPCNCFVAYGCESYGFTLDWHPLRIHDERQDTNTEAWKRLSNLIDEAAEDGRAVFAPGIELGAELWFSIIELPRTIGKLKAVKTLDIANLGSMLVRIPPEIGEMESLEEFLVYKSHSLHYVPYEITHCQNLKRTFVSTRALYGNWKNRPPFPKLPQLDIEGIVPAKCSVCRGPFPQTGPIQRWISLRLDRKDVFPLLVHACSDDCIRSLPKPADRYVDSPHCGGLDLVQPR